MPGVRLARLRHHSTHGPKTIHPAAPLPRLPRGPGATRYCARMRTRLLIGLLSLTALLTAAACGSDDDAADSSRTGITTRTPAAGATPGPATTPRSSAAEPVLPGAAPGEAMLEWASTFCAVTSGFDEAVVAVQDNLNPRELEFEERRERALRRYDAYAEAAEFGAFLMEQLDPPAEVAPYQEAVTDQLRGLALVFAEQIERITAAEEHADIEDAVEALERDVERVEAPVRAARLLLDRAAHEALDSMPFCGLIVG